MNCQYLQNLKSYEPPFTQNQNHLCDWIASMHAFAETLSQNKEPLHYENQANYFKKLLQKCGLSEDKIATRKVFINDFDKKLDESKLIYNLDTSGKASTCDQRTKFFDVTCSKALDDIYSTTSTPPDHIIHTTCTGYLSPSPAQKLVSKKMWGQDTSVFHAYHMGCYASIPSIKAAQGYITSGASHVDVIHTELCSLHMDPHNNSMGQLVIESLFADGIISYSIYDQKNETQNGFKILKAKEELISSSLHGMSWETGPYGFLMTLSKDVPSLISEAINSYIERLLQPYNLSTKDCLFAIHPGGPKIIDQIAQSLNLEPRQYAKTLEILKTRGNMSSATLPHVWELIANDKSIASGTYVISLAFGPGLTIAGVLLQKL